jgi:hypothetical protein
MRLGIRVLSGLHGTTLILHYTSLSRVALSTYFRDCFTFTVLDVSRVL